MKQYFGAILRFFKACFLYFLDCLYSYFAFGDIYPVLMAVRGSVWLNCAFCLAMAVVFSMAHTIITSDLCLSGLVLIVNRHS